MPGTSRKDWEARWEEGRIRFHQEQPNSLLAEHFPKLKAVPDAHCLVPLCGKSLDMVWIAKQRQLITGVEFSALAVQTFLQQLGSHPTVVALNENLLSFRSAPYHLIQGNLFDLTPDRIPPVDWIFDRASLVAFPPDEQKKYVDHLSSFLTKGKEILLVTYETSNAEDPGPPFGVSRDRVRELYADNYTIEWLGSRDGESAYQLTKIQ